MKLFAEKDLVIVDTAGRHKEERELIREMKALEQKIKPDEIVMVIDGTIGQQALSPRQKALHEATPIGALYLVTKLEVLPRGGGSFICSRSNRWLPSNLIGTGEKVEDI